MKTKNFNVTGEMVFLLIIEFIINKIVNSLDINISEKD